MTRECYKLRMCDNYDPSFLSEDDGDVAVEIQSPDGRKRLISELEI